jgi:hypothetical protein
VPALVYIKQNLYFSYYLMKCPKLNGAMPDKKKLFISYAHKDAPFFGVFKEALTSYLGNSDNYTFEVWQDADIIVGDNWDNDIQQNLSQADIAVLCVSSFFLNSAYIKASEFETLFTKYSGKLIIPVYFGPCDFNAWKSLATRQFFKPNGDKYDKLGEDDFSFCDLVTYSSDNKTPNPNINIAKYCKDLVKKIESAIADKEPKSDPIPIPPRPLPDPIPIPPTPLPEPKTNDDKLVKKILEGAMIIFGLLSVYFLVSNQDGAQFKTCSSGAMFFGSVGLLVMKKK